MTRKAAIAILTIVSATACSGSIDTATAEAAATQFHELLDAGSFSRIYQESAEEFKKASSEANFVALLTAVHRKLGNTRSSTKQSWRTNFSTSGTFVTLTYKTIFAEGEGAEQFVFKSHDNSAVLVGYHITSNELILK